MAPSRQKSLSCDAAWPSRFQWAEFIACQMPFRFGCAADPARRRFAPSTVRGTAATKASAATNETVNPCRILPPN